MLLFNTRANLNYMTQEKGMRNDLIIMKLADPLTSPNHTWP